jgi:hypothetical protein
MTGAPGNSADDTDKQPPTDNKKAAPDTKSDGASK